MTFEICEWILYVERYYDNDDALNGEENKQHLPAYYIPI